MVNQDSNEGTVLTIYDVVCGMSTDYGKWTSVSEHEGQEYFFCCDGCKGAFEKNPAYHLENFAQDHPELVPTPDVDEVLGDDEE